MRGVALALVAGLAAGTPAMALDLPAEARAPSAEPCPGKPGFVRLPGTRSCTRLSGRVVSGGALATAGERAAAAPDIAGRIAIDNRTETEFGEVRTYVRIGTGRR